eukprot:363353-Chlamydomonas_euryale.AAC.13
MLRRARQGRSLAKLGAFDSPLNKRNEKAAMRALSGVAAYTLSRFTTTLAADQEGLAAGMVPVLPAAEGSGGAPARGSLRVPLTDDVRLAVRLRVEKKKILSAAIQAMGRQLTALPRMDVPASPSAPRKGQGPPAATDRGFGKRAN